MRKQRVTPEQFSILCVALLELEGRGYDPETCTRQAYKRAGIPSPKPFEDVEIVVDRELRL
jgi:hypothetical protein